MKIVITEDQKKKLFRPIGLSGEDSRYAKWNKEQPIKDGQPINQYSDNGKKTGYWEEYYRNGKLYYKGSYKDDKKEGYWEWYWENGNSAYKGSYVNGKKDGVWENYQYPNGKLSNKGLYKDGELVKRSYMNEAEEPKKKLFRPIGLDSRQEQLKNEIKKFLISIKDSIVWEYLGSIETDYNYISDDGGQSYFDFNGRYLNLSEVKNVFINEYGKEEGNIKYYDFQSKVDKITGYMEGLLSVHGEGNVSYVWNEIKDLGEGHLEFNQSRNVRIDKKIKDIKI